MPYRLFFSNHPKTIRKLNANNCTCKCKKTNAQTNPSIISSALQLSQSNDTAWELIDSIAPYLPYQNKCIAHQTMHYANFFTELNCGSQGSELEKTLHRTKMLSGVTNTDTSCFQEKLKLGITIDDIVSNPGYKKSRCSNCGPSCSKKRISKLRRLFC